MTFEKVNIFGLSVNITDYGKLITYIENVLNDEVKTTMVYANAHTLNGVYKNKELLKVMNSFDFVYPDGIGFYRASRYLYGNSGLTTRFNGSDFYPYLAEKAIEKKWNIFFFGHDDDTLRRINKNYTELLIAGINEGYNFADTDLVSKINLSNAKIVVIGLGFPKQEIWLAKNRDKLNCTLVISVGDGIKVFSGTKLRGPAFLRKIGLEWFIRLLSSPLKYWKRYLIGNPLFLYRIFRYKMAKLSTGNQ